MHGDRCEQWPQFQNKPPPMGPIPISIRPDASLDPIFVGSFEAHVGPKRGPNN